MLPCDSGPCENDGGCFNVGNSSFECKCLSGYSGKRCQDKGMKNNFSFCKSFSIYHWYFITYYTKIYHFFLSINQVSVCHSEPCQNGGKCLNVGDSFECECPSDYSGKRCQNKGI